MYRITILVQQTQIQIHRHPTTFITSKGTCICPNWNNHNYCPLPLFQKWNNNSQQCWDTTKFLTQFMGEGVEEVCAPPPPHKFKNSIQWCLYILELLVGMLIKISKMPRYIVDLFCQNLIKINIQILRKIKTITPLIKSFEETKYF